VWKAGDILPPITPYYVMKVGHVPLISYHRPGEAIVGELVAEQIELMHRQRTPIRAVMIDRLGPNVWHSTPTGAMAALEELEETARLWLLASPKPEPLSEEQIDQLRRHFGASW
jgi:ribulose-5-phosphate 4-epimerase/fuculose-1-phosphate aldolase